MSAFKAYDIRGIYNKDFNKETAYKIGFFLKNLFDANEIIVGRDIRVSSDEIYEYLVKGITDSGVDVLDLSLCTTPTVYYALINSQVKTGVMITASHNPKEYNGIKISGPKAIPVGQETGLRDLEKWVCEKEIVPSYKKGKIIDYSIKDDYINFFKEKLSDISNLNIVMDCSSGMASLYVKEIFGDKVKYFLDELDGEFSIHSPNPLEAKNRELIVKKVKENKSNIGIIFDGDADRVMFIDNKGRFISPDLIINLLANYLIDKKGEKVVIDIRSSKSVYYYIKEMGGQPIIWKVGHVFAKDKIKNENALFGGELAGHYYFKEFGNCDSGILACVYVLNSLKEFVEDGIEIADIIDEFSVFSYSGEQNFKVYNKEEKIRKLTEFYNDKDYIKFYDFDGIRYDFDDWWFNVRLSNTEPYLRLVLEAKNEEMMNEKLKEVKSIMELE